MSAATAPVTSEQERVDLFAVYLTLRGLHHFDFEEALQIPVVRGCLRNTLEAMRRRRARAKARIAADPADFQLAP